MALSINEIYKRLAETLGVSLKVVKEIHKGYGKVYLECISNGESFPLPYIGQIDLIPFADNLVRNPKTDIKTERVTKYRLKFKMSKKSKRAIRK